MTKTRAVLFDLAGTVVSMGMFKDHGWTMAREFSRILGFDESHNERVEQALTQGPPKPAEESIISTFFLFHDVFSERYIATAQSLGAVLQEADARRLSSIWWEGCAAHFSKLGLQGGGLRIGAIETLKTLRNNGIHIGLVSNFDEHDLQNFLAVGNFGSYFDAHLSSEVAKSCKPDAAIYDIALQQAGCSAEEAIFVGDTPTQDIDGAVAAGIRSVLIRSETKTVGKGPKPTHQPDHKINELPELLSLLS